MVYSSGISLFQGKSGRRSANRFFAIFAAANQKVKPIMKKKLTLLSILLAVVFSPIANLSAQSEGKHTLKRHHVALDLLGNKGFVGASYEYRLGDKINWLGLRAGLGFMGVSQSGLYTSGDSFLWGKVAAEAVLLPMECNVLLGAKNHHLELGLGMVPLLARGHSSAYYNDHLQEDSSYGFAFGGNATVAYRYQRPQGGFVFRIGLSPMFKIPFIDNYISTSAIWPFLSLGYSF
ncbi:hypothetical protein HR09_03160 [Porphyromonas gulae]|nr:hypothetical protein HR09_03160 [Porphyromonas gulae]